MGSAPLGLLLALTVGCGCQGRETRDLEATHVVPSSRADATQAVKDERRGFRLGWPGSGWKLLGEADARQLHPDAAAGALSDDGIAAVVIVRPALPVALPSYTEALLNSLPLDDKTIERNESISLNGHEARRFGLEGKLDGVELRYAGLVAGTEGAFIRLVAWQSAATPCAEDQCFVPLLNAFSLLDGAPRPPSAPPLAPTDARGVGWRVKAGVFESSVSGLRVRPPVGWILLVGGSLERLAPDAEVGLMHADSGVTLLLASERISTPAAAPPPGAPGYHPPFAPGAYHPPGTPAIAQPSATQPTGWPRPASAPSAPPPPNAASGAAPRPWSYGAAQPATISTCPAPPPGAITGDPLVVAGELAGHRLELKGGRSGDTDRLSAAVSADDRCLAVRASYRSAARDGARPLLAAGLAAVSALSASDRRALADELAQAGNPQNAVGTDFALRAGTYRSFRWRLTWTKPEGAWRLVAAPSSSSLEKGALLAMEQRTLGLHALLWAEAAGSDKPSVYHQRAGELRSGQVGATFHRPQPATIEGGEAHVSEGDGSESGRPLRYRLVTTVHDGTGIQVLIWGPMAAMAAHAEEVNAVVEGLHLRPTLTAIEPRAEVYRDHRLGFELSPPSAWSFADLTPPELAPIGSFVRWEHNGRWVGVVAVCLPSDLGGSDWFEGLLEQLLREALGPIARGTAARSASRLGGRDAHHVVWQAALQRVDAAIARQDDTLYAVVTVDRGQEAFEKTAPGLVLLP